MSTKECGLKEREVAMEYSPNDVETISKDIGFMTKEKDKAHTSFHKKIKYLLENGSLMLPKQEYIQRYKIQTLLKQKDKNTLQINIYFQNLHKLDSKIQQQFFKNQLKKFERTEHHIEQNISHWMSYTQSHNYYNYNVNLAQQSMKMTLFLNYHSKRF